MPAEIRPDAIARQISHSEHQHSPPRALILIGGGGHALVAAECAAAAGLGVAGFLDDDTGAPLGAAEQGGLGLRRLGGTAERDVRALLEGELAERAGGGSIGWLLAIGAIAVRRGLIERIAALGAGCPACSLAQALTVIHPRAVVSPSARLGRGVLVGPGAIINARAEIGEHTIINSGAVVEHECVLGSNVHVAPGAVLAGRTVVGADTLVGVGARALPGVRIGAGCTVGVGAVVVGPVADGATVVGVPARGRP